MHTPAALAIKQVYEGYIVFCDEIICVCACLSGTVHLLRPVL